MEGTGRAGGPSSVSVGRAVAAAAVIGAAAAALTASDGRRLAVCFLRWARDTDRAKAEEAAAAAEAALAAADREAKREREAWESLQATLEGSAAAREREAREAAEEAGRKVRARPALYEMKPLSPWGRGGEVCILVECSRRSLKSDRPDMAAKEGAQQPRRVFTEPGSRSTKREAPR